MTVIPRSPSSIRGSGAGAHRAAEPVAVVGDQHRETTVVLRLAGAAPPQVQVLPVGAGDVGDGVEDGSQLGVAVAGVLDRLGVEPRARRC